MRIYPRKGESVLLLVMPIVLFMNLIFFNDDDCCFPATSTRLWRLVLEKWITAVAAHDAPFSFLLHSCAKLSRRCVCWHLPPSEDICCLLLTFVGICWVPTQFHLDLAGDRGGAVQKGKDFSRSQSSQFSTSSFGFRRLENLNTFTQLPTIFRNIEFER